MNILENRQLSYLVRYKTAISQLLFNPHHFYNTPPQYEFITPIKFYFTSHYLYLFLSLPVLSTLLERTRFFLRLNGYLELASSNILNTDVFFLINMLPIPFLVIFILFAVGLYFKLILNRYKTRVGHLFSTLVSAYCTALLPTFVFMVFFFLLDRFVFANIVWLYIGFMGGPVIFLMIDYYLVRRALRIKYKIEKYLIHFFMLSPLFLLLLILFVIYLYGLLVV